MSEQEPSGAATGRPVSLGESGSGAKPEPGDRLTCGCGHGRTHYLVSPVPTYTGWGKFWVIFMGVSTKPARVDFKCRQCRRIFDFTDDPHELGEFL